MSKLYSLTAAQLNRAADLKEKIEALNIELSAILREAMLVTKSTPPRKARKKIRAANVTDEQILAYLKTERSAGEIGKSLGQLISKRVAAMVNDGKVTSR